MGIILDPQGGTTVLRKILIRDKGRQESQWQRGRCNWEAEIRVIGGRDQGQLLGGGKCRGHILLSRRNIVLLTP